jgi:uncharacterized membrane protein
MWYSEQNLIDRVARFTPFFVLAIPATFAYQNVTNPALLNMHPAIGLLIAVSIEGLGLAAVHTSLSLFEYLKQHKQKMNGEAATMLFMTLFYLAVVVMVNIVLDMQHEWQIITAKALLSLVSIPAAVTLSIRQLHKARLNDEAENKAELTARGKLGALTKKYNDLEATSEKLKQGNAELKQANADLLKQLEQAKKQPVKQETLTAVSKPTTKRASKKQSSADILECPDCGKECNGIKGLNGHKAWCKGKPVMELIKANGHVKEKSH